jgi:hypothetical protein
MVVSLAVCVLSLLGHPLAEASTPPTTTTIGWDLRVTVTGVEKHSDGVSVTFTIDNLGPGATPGTIELGVGIWGNNYGSFGGSDFDCAMYARSSAHCTHDGSLQPGSALTVIVDVGRFLNTVGASVSAGAAAGDPLQALPDLNPANDSASARVDLDNPSEPGPPLPGTGANASLVGPIALVLAGVMLIVVTRRRLSSGR